MLSKGKRFCLTCVAVAVFCLSFSGRLATMQQADVQRADSDAPPVASAPAAGIQLQPQIAKGANSSLAVWADRRTVLGRYVPDDNAGIGSDTDIYAARYDADGNLIDASPIIVNENIYEQYYPRVAWNGQSWLVVWITRRLTNQFEYDLKAVRVAPDGRVLDAIPINLTAGQISPANYINVSSDGSNFVVVWGSGGNQSTINASRIAANGTLLDVTPKILFTDTNFTAPFQADIAFANNQFLVVWETTNNNNAIRARRFDMNLDPLGSEIAFGSGGANSPRVATDGTNFLVAWREQRFTYNEMFAARISAAGQNLDPNGIKLYGDLNDYILQFYTAVAWDGNAYVVASHRGDSGQAGQISVSRVSNTGTVLTPAPLLVGSNYSSQPAVAALANGGVKLLWVDKFLSADGDIFSATITNNTVGTAAPASLAGPRETNIRFTKTEAGTFAYSYRSTVSGASSVYLQRLAADGNQIGAPTLVVQGAEAITNPSVAWNGSVYLVVWELDTQIYGRRVAADGTVIGDAFPIMIGNTPDVAALGSQFLVVVSFPETSEIRNTRAVRVDGNGTVLGTPVKIGSNFDLRPRVRAFATRWLVVWEQDISHDNTNSTIIAAFVEADGTSPGRFAVSNSFSDAPHLAIGGDTALVVWQNSNKIYGRRVKNDGTILGNIFLVAQSTRTLYAPAAAWDGSRFVVTFADSRNSTMLPPADIWATLVGLDGSLLTPAQFPVAASPLPEEMPSVEAANGVTTFGYSQFDDRAPYTSYRVRLRRFPFDTNYNVSVTPYQRQIAPGGTTTYTVTVNPQNNFSGEVSLSVYGLPDGATAAIDPATITGSGSATLTVTTSNTTPENIYRLTITATSGAQQSTAEAILFVDSNPPPVGYAVTDLGTLGGNGSAAYDINQSGQVVGYALNAAQQRRAFLYTNGQMQDIGTLGGQTATAYGISDTGKVAGVSGINGLEDARAFFYDGATMQNLGVYQTNTSADRSAAFAVNNANQIVGESSAVSTSRLAFIYQNGSMTLVGNPFAFDSAYDINNAGKIVGSKYVGGITKSYLIGSDNASPTFIEPLGGRNSYARAVNNNNQVVGSADYSMNNVFQHAFLYSNGQLRDINGLNAPQSFAYGINDAGIVVGNINLTSFGDPRAFIYDGTTMRNLNSLIPQNSGWVLQEARAINNDGQIVGSGLINNQTHAFLLSASGTQNTPPSVRIISPATNRNLSQPAAITISADAADTDGTIVRVEFYADNILIGTATSQPYAILWSSATANHTYTLTAKAFDNAGAVTVSAPVTITVGASANVRTPFDFDGDGKADVSVFRPSNGTWYLQQSAGGFAAAQFGLAADKLAPADYDGDGKTDIAVFRDGAWYLQQSSDGFRAVQFGTSGDVPQPGDYDGDGKADIAVFRPSNGAWYMLGSLNGFTQLQFGQNGDQPVAADFDGDGKYDAAVYRAGSWYVLGSRDGFAAQQFGVTTDVPVVGDYDGDGKADYAVFRSGVWYQQRSRDGFQGIQFGISSDVPAPGDYDGDGKTDVAVFRSGNWYIQSGANGLTSIQFGVSSDVPAPSSYLLR